MTQTVTITARRGTTSVHVADQTLPVGEPVDGLTEETITALEAIPGVTVTVAGEPDEDNPAPPTPTTEE